MSTVSDTSAVPPFPLTSVSSISTQTSITYSPINAPAVTTAVTDSGIASAVVTTYSVLTTSEAGIESLSFVTNPAVYSSLVSAGEASTVSTKTDVSTSSGTKSQTSTSSGIVSQTSGATASKKTSPSLSTLIPAIVVPILVILLAIGLTWFLIKRRRRQQAPGIERTQIRFEKPELDTKELPRTHGRAELYSSRGDSILRRFTHGSGRSQKRTIHELPGSEPTVAEVEGNSVDAGDNT